MISEKDYNQGVKDYTKNLFRYLYKSLRDKEAAQDLVQDCFLKLWNNRNNVDALKLKSWLFAVAHNSMLNYIKVQSRKQSLDNEWADNLPIVFQTDFELKEIIDLALTQLDPLMKSILLLRDLEGYNYKEIGEILQLNEPQVKVYLFRARQKMKNHIQQLTVEL